jgi:hypothetical protein
MDLQVEGELRDCRREIALLFRNGLLCGCRLPEKLCAEDSIDRYLIWTGFYHRYNWHVN